MTRPTTDPPGPGSERLREWGEEGDVETVSLLDSLPDPGRAPRIFLVVRNGDRVAVVDLPEGTGEMIIGRSPEAHISIDAQEASRHHAKVRISRGLLTAEDLGSRNGTLVSGRLLRGTTARIGIGDVIEVGGCQIAVCADAGRLAPSPVGSGDTGDLVMADPEMARIYATASKVARMPTTVLILGETGTGKDILARHIHGWSQRSLKPFVRVNCTGIPDSLLESELFGYERGAFTGADRRKIGYFEAASGGTIFLDEIGELSAAAQGKLLNVIENRTVNRLGGTAPISVDVRIVCATHRNLQALVSEERFRADLYFRISPFVIRIPPLRERVAEIPLFTSVFVRSVAAQSGHPPPLVAADAIAMLTKYPWPGNVRELRNAVEHALAMGEGEMLQKEDFAAEVRGVAPPGERPRAPVRPRLAEVERETIDLALAAEGGNQTRAAARLGMPRRTLVYKLAQYRRESEKDGEKP